MEWSRAGPPPEHDPCRPAVAANPFITFFTVANDSGKFEFEWIGDKGFAETASASITVE